MLTENLDDTECKQFFTYDGCYTDLVGEYEYLKDNEYILFGYRIGLNPWQATKSIVHKTNETVNILSHYIGSIFALSLLFIVYFHQPRNVVTGEKIDAKGLLDFEHTFIMVVFLLSAFTCQFMSATYHTYCCVNPRLYKILRKMDYFAINILIFGTAIVGYYYYFFEGHRFWFYLYMVLSITISLSITIVVVLPKFATSDYRRLRAVLYSFYGLISGVPVIQSISLPTMTYEAWISINLWFILGGVSYITGSITYSARVPERLYPGYFDYFGASHQIFHILVTVGVAMHFTALLRLLDWRISSGFLPT